MTDPSLRYLLVVGPNGGSRDIVEFASDSEPLPDDTQRPTSTSTQRSVSTFDADRTQINPQVTITQATITVTLARSGGAGGPVCNLQGVNGNAARYSFTRGGRYSISAGDYLHWVGGTITIPYLDGAIWRYDGRLTSTVEYG